MWNPDQYTQALYFAAEAHAKQQVPDSSMNYLAHVTNVAMEVANALVQTADHNLDTSRALQAALLHDTIEDTAVTHEQLIATFGQAVADDVLALTKNEELPTKTTQMQDSLQRIVQQSQEARLIKLADRVSNLKQPPSYWSQEKRKAYQKEAQLILDTLAGTNDYLEQRFAKRIQAYQQYIEA